MEELSTNNITKTLVPMSKEVLTWCHEETNLFAQDPLFDWFYKDPRLSVVNYDEYRKVVSTPICIKDVKKRLTNGAYRFMHEWLYDLELVFRNALLYNPPNTMPHEISRYALSVLKKDIEKIAFTDEEEKLLQIKELADKYMKNMAKLEPDLDIFDNPNEYILIFPNSSKEALDFEVADTPDDIRDAFLTVFGNDS